MDTHGKRLTLKAADLRANPVTQAEREMLRKRFKEVKIEPDVPNPPEIPLPRNAGEAKQMIAAFQEEFKKLETDYRERLARSDTEITLSKDKIFKLVDERIQIDDELEETRSILKEYKSQLQEREITIHGLQSNIQELRYENAVKTRELDRLTKSMQESRDTVTILQGQADSAITEANKSKTKRRESQCLLQDALVEMEDLRQSMAFTSAAALGHEQNKAVHQLSSMILSRDNAPTLPPKVQKLTSKPVLTTQRSMPLQPTPEPFSPDIGQHSKVQTLQEKVNRLANSHTTKYIEALYRLQDAYDQLLVLCGKIPQDTEMEELREDVEINKEETDRHIEEINRQNMADNEELFGKLLPKSGNSKISRLKVQLETLKSENIGLQMRLSKHSRHRKDEEFDDSPAYGLCTKDMIAILQCHAQTIEDVLN